MRERHWYIPALMLDDRWTISDTLADIMSIVVIPDLAEPEVRRLLAAWAHDAPVELIRALSAAAEQAGGAAVARLEAAMRAPIYRRWLREHGIHSHAPTR